MKNLIGQRHRRGWQLGVVLCLVTGTALVAAQSLPVKPASSRSTPPATKTALDELFKQLLARPAPQPVPEGSATEKKVERPDLFDQGKPPADNAPIDELVAYWSRWSYANQAAQPKPPSTVVVERLLGACEVDPKPLAELVSYLGDAKDAAERIKKLFDAAQNDANLEDEWRQKIGKWLLFNSTYFLPELTRLAERAKDKDSYVDNEEALTALAKVDPEAAKPMLQAFSLSSQPRTAALALAQLYQISQGASDGADPSSAEQYRTQLKAIAEDRNAPTRARDLAITQLSRSDWSGRDDWYLSLFTDETLLDGQDGYTIFNPLTELFDREPERWTTILAGLVESKNPAVRRNAGNCLFQYVNREPTRAAILPLLRWLSDPDWLDSNSTKRAWFVQKLDAVEVPESIPGLIWILENEEDNLRYAADVLAHYKDPRAVPALKRALEQAKDENDREYIYKGLLACGGVTDAELLDALEAYAAKLTTAAGREEVTRYRYDDADPLPVPVSLGKYLAAQKAAPESLVRAVLDRADGLQRTEPALARALIEAAQNWQTKLVDLDLVRRISDGTADADLIVQALDRRSRLAETVAAELRASTGARGIAPSVIAAILSDEVLAQNLIGTNDEQKQIALLACARLVQLHLPLTPVSSMLGSKSELLALAARKYLLADDSRTARQLLWGHFAQQGFITGWRESSAFLSGDLSALAEAEANLRGELFAKDAAPIQIFALLVDRVLPYEVIRVYASHAVYFRYDDESRYRYRTITPEEMEGFRTFLATSNIVDSGPQIGPCHHDCTLGEFVALSRDGGRRVFSHQSYTSWLSVELNFNRLSHDAKTHYRLAEVIPGAEVLVADDQLTVGSVWQNGADVRVLVQREKTADEIREEEVDRNRENENEEDSAAMEAQRRRTLAARERALITWRQFKDGNVDESTTAPPNYFGGLREQFDLVNEEFPAQLNDHLAGARAGSYLLVAGISDQAGLWRKTSGGAATRITGEGDYADPVVTADGKWVVATKAEPDSHWGDPKYLVRIDLRTNREYRINLAPAQNLEPIAYLAPTGKILLHRARDEDSDDPKNGPATPEFYLLDPATGVSKLVTGNFAPLLEESSRPLQPAGTLDQVWAAIPDHAKNETRVGRYNLRDFSFQLVLTIPRLSFESMKMWVDEVNGKVYIVYEGQLIRIPLAAANAK